MQMKQCIYRVISQQLDTRKRGLQKIALICLLCLVFSSFLSPVSLTMAAIDVADKMDSIKNISFPLLFISIIILLYSIVRLLEYRRVLEKITE
jgi:ABC-type enterochelin transport system permease subunit